MGVFKFSCLSPYYPVAQTRYGKRLHRNAQLFTKHHKCRMTRGVKATSPLVYHKVALWGDTTTNRSGHFMLPAMVGSVAPRNGQSYVFLIVAVGNPCCCVWSPETESCDLRPVSHESSSQSHISPSKPSPCRTIPSSYHPPSPCPCPSRTP